MAHPDQGRSARRGSEQTEVLRPVTLGTAGTESFSPRSACAQSRGERTMTMISKDARLATLINVFTVAPENQQQLAELLVHATEATMRHLPGFISANIHKSLDGTRVVNYAQWQTREAFEAMLKNPKAIPHMKDAASLAQHDPHLYEVVEAIPG